MKWQEFLERYGDCPIIEPEMLYVGAPNPNALQVQLSRWVSSGRLVKLARGKYLIAKPYRKVDPPVEYVANQLVYPSYISLEYALAWHGLIPESVPMVTSVTTRRPQTYETVLGAFRYRHIKQGLFWGYEVVSLQGLKCVVAYPEKALLDLFYFWNGPATRKRIEEMRFQNLDQIDPERIRSFAKRTTSRKLLKGAIEFLRYRERLLEEYELR